ncbi:MAG TPA: hemerythrin domain-containing protein [Magnetospirillum sp.]|jgi:hemerythrin|nr:hemerythrin domain-containing protein [Magnetospirillum sp.]
MSLQAAVDLPLRPLEWLDSFTIGDDGIDGEHRAVIDAANDLCALALATRDAATLRGAARELIAVVEAHFASEEALFPSIGFTGMLTHMREHLSIRQSLIELLLSEGPMPAPVAAATARLLLVEHMVRYDLGFKTWVQHLRGY